MNQGSKNLNKDSTKFKDGKKAKIDSNWEFSTKKQIQFENHCN